MKFALESVEQHAISLQRNSEQNEYISDYKSRMKTTNIPGNIEKTRIKS